MFLGPHALRKAHSHCAKIETKTKFLFLIFFSFSLLFLAFKPMRIGPYLAAGSATATHANCVLCNEELCAVFFHNNTFHSLFPDILITIESLFLYINFSRKFPLICMFHRGKLHLTRPCNVSLYVLTHRHSIVTVVCVSYPG